AGDALEAALAPALVAAVVIVGLALAGFSEASPPDLRSTKITVAVVNTPGTLSAAASKSVRAEGCSCPSGCEGGGGAGKTGDRAERVAPGASTAEVDVMADGSWAAMVDGCWAAVVGSHCGYTASPGADAGGGASPRAGARASGRWKLSE